jgi:hypothetical protein
MRGNDAPVEVPRFDRGAVPGGEDQPGIDPAVTGPDPIDVLLFPADLQGRNAQVGQGNGASDVSVSRISRRSLCPTR